MGRLLMGAVQTAPVVPDFYSQVAAAMIEVDAQGGGRFSVPLKSTFVRRGILSPQSGVAMGFLHRAVREAGPAAERGTRTTKTRDLPLQAIDASPYGFGTTPLFVHVSAQVRRVAALSAAPGVGTVVAPSSDRAARTFVEHLMRMGRIDLESSGLPSGYVSHPRARKTHRLERVDGTGLVLRRTLFYCGFCSHRR
jgi:hypothetical protein